MSTFLDKRFEEFKAAIKNVTEPGVVSWLGQPLEFGKKPGLEGLNIIIIKGAEYPLDENLEAKARLAKDGLLGPELIPMGKRCWEDVQQRIRRTRIKEIYQDLKEQWAELTPIIWKLHINAARGHKIATATKKVLAAALMEVPMTARDAVKLGVRLPYMENAEWATVKKLVVAIRAEEKRRADAALADAIAKQLVTSAPTKPESETEPKAD